VTAIAQGAGEHATSRHSTAGWPLALRLARRELRGGLKGFRIFLACLTLGVTAIAGVGSLSDSVLTGLQRDGRILLGGDMDLRLIHVAADAEQQAFLDSRAEVSRVAEMRAMARGQAQDARRVLVELRAVDNLYPLFGAAEVDPAPGQPAALGPDDRAPDALPPRGLVPLRHGAAGGQPGEQPARPHAAQMGSAPHPDSLAQGRPHPSRAGRPAGREPSRRVRR